MEEVLKVVSTFDGLFFRIVNLTLNKIKHGCLELHFNGNKISYGDKNSQVREKINVYNFNFFKAIVLSGEVGLGESYMRAEWGSPDLKGVISLLIKNQEYLGDSSAVGNSSKFVAINFLNFLNQIQHKMKSNSKTNSLKNISYHYDLSNDLYKLMLDKTMMYSSGLFLSQNDSLEQSQYNKLNQIYDFLKLNSDDNLLEIGTGWGGLVNYVADKIKVPTTTVTISNQQLNYAKELTKKNGHEHIDLKFQDYRDLSGTYSKIVSVEMIEAVGEKYLDSFFAKVSSLLKSDGRFVMQAILMPNSRYENYKKSNDWIEKYIFPGGHLPSMERLLNAASKSNLEMIEMKEFGMSYAETLKLWHENFKSNLIAIKELGFDSRFIRMWEYYLKICEAAFETRNIYVAQLVFVRPNTN